MASDCTSTGKDSKARCKAALSVTAIQVAWHASVSHRPQSTSLYARRFAISFISIQHSNKDQMVFKIITFVEELRDDVPRLHLKPEWPQGSLRLPSSAYHIGRPL